MLAWARVDPSSHCDEGCTRQTDHHDGTLLPVSNSMASPRHSEVLTALPIYASDVQLVNDVQPLRLLMLLLASPDLFLFPLVTFLAFPPSLASAPLFGLCARWAVFAFSVGYAWPLHYRRLGCAALLSRRTEAPFDRALGTSWGPRWCAAVHGVSGSRALSRKGA